MQRSFSPKRKKIMFKKAEFDQHAKTFKHDNQIIKRLNQIFFSALHFREFASLLSASLVNRSIFQKRLTHLYMT